MMRKYSSRTLAIPPTPQHQETSRNLVGDLRYMVDRTWKDLDCMTGMFGPALKKPSARHWAELEEVISYLKLTIYAGIRFAGGQQ